MPFLIQNALNVVSQKLALYNNTTIRGVPSTEEDNTSSEFELLSRNWKILPQEQLRGFFLVVQKLSCYSFFSSAQSAYVLCGTFSQYLSHDPHRPLNP